MIPAANGYLEDLEIEEMPTKTYKMHLDQDYISGYCNEREALKQTVYKILNTERYQYIIYAWNYGIELSDLFGEPISYVCPEIERRVTEALIQDTRINSCSTFSFDTREQGTVRVSFIVHSIYGDFDMNTEVSV